MACRFDRVPIVPYLAVAGLAALVFLPTLGNGFVWDDHYLIDERNSWQEPWSGFVERFRIGSNPTPYYRPLVTLSFALDHALWGLNPLGYHLANILLYAATAGVFLALLRRLLDPLAAFLAAAVFIVHPLHVETVSFISCRGDLLAVFFLVLSLWFLVRGATPSEQHGRRNLAVASVFFLLAALSKEASLMFPLVCFAILWRGRGGEPGAIRRAAAKSVPFLLALAAYLGLRALALARDPLPSAGGEWTLGLGIYPAFMKEVIRLILFPVKLVPYYEYVPLGPAGMALWSIAAALLLTLVWLFGGIRRFDTPFIIGAGLLLLSTLMILPSFRNVGALLAERFLYSPSLGAALLLGCLLESLVRRFPGAPTRLAVSMSALLIILMGTWSLLRSRDWRDDVTLFGRALEREPGNASIHYQLADRLYRSGDVAGAEREALRAVTLRPRFAEARLVLGAIYWASGRWEPARLQYQEAVLAAPDNIIARCNLGRAEMARGSDRAAAENLLAAVRLDGRCVAALQSLGDLYFRQGRLDQAETAWRQAASVDPGNAALQTGLGIIARRQGRPAEAEAFFLRALELKPDHAMARLNLDDLRREATKGPPRSLP